MLASSEGSFTWKTFWLGNFYYSLFKQQFFSFWDGKKKTFDTFNFPQTKVVFFQCPWCFSKVIELELSLTSKISGLNCIVPVNSTFAVSSYARFKLWTFIFLGIASEIGKNVQSFLRSCLYFSKWSLKALPGPEDTFGSLQATNYPVIFRSVFIQLEIHRRLIFLS